MEADGAVILTWRNLVLADETVRRALNGRLSEEASCSLLEHDLLAWVAAAPERGLRMQELADRLGVTPGGLTRIVDRLVSRGWIERDRPSSNRREVYAVLTYDGRRAMTRARAVYLRVLRETLGTHLDEPELAELGRISGKLLAGLAGPTGLTEDPPLRPGSES
ncbi:MarR family winged helix-turn-helix transcriptional regulator [Streptomyces sp. NPDC051018]|uniref:MarR family winged helix-turn-helix transcriptional regulator n=1 Tax=Streptomyces sp. NPDC051018 TaxID=3365639 RepID=UPI0037AB3ECF